MTDPSPAAGPIYSDFRDEADMLEMIELFVEDMEGRVESLRAALDESDWRRLTTLAHQLKGASGGYGFAPVGEAAAKLEGTLRAGETEDLERLKAQTDEVIELCNRVRA